MLLNKVFNAFVFISLLTLISGCTRQESTSSEAADSVSSEDISGDNSASANELSEEDEDINDEDHGGPGIEDTKKEFSELEPFVQEFLINLKRGNIEALIDTTFLILVPGPGVQPLVSIGKNKNDFAAFDSELLKDSTIINNSPIYTWEFDVCNSESLSDGIYINSAYIDPIDPTIAEENKASLIKDLNNKMQKLNYKYSTDFAFKFTGKDGAGKLLNVRTFFRENKLYVMMIDQRDCGA